MSHTPGALRAAQVIVDMFDEVTVSRIAGAIDYATGPEKGLQDAAPDLLEALGHLVDAQNGPPLLGPKEEFWNEAMRKADAAIAKAEGKP